LSCRAMRMLEVLLAAAGKPGLSAWTYHHARGPQDAHDRNFSDLRR